MENKQLRKAVASLPCVNCGLEGSSQAAHSNDWKHGKGRGMKSTDSAIFPLCCDRVGVRGCHYKFDQYLLFSNDESKYWEAPWIADTYIKLMELGYLKVTYKG